MSFYYHAPYFTQNSYRSTITGKRIVRFFKTRREAKQYEKDFYLRRLPAKSDDRHLSEFVDLWFELHGRSLKSAVDTRDRLLKLSVFFG